VLERLGEAERALVVGHSPTNEAAVLGLPGQQVAPLAKGAGVLVVADATVTQDRHLGHQSPPHE
jgi:phosphohistidine phosphatase SixA